MNLGTLNAILDRIEAGTNSRADLVNLRALINAGPPPQPQPASPQVPQEPQRDPDLVCGFHKYPTADRAGAAATVAVTYTRDRYTRGEIVLAAIYHLEDGSIQTDPTHRVPVSPQTHYFICDLWEALFDQVSIVKAYCPATTAIHLDLPQLKSGLHHQVRTTAEIVAGELGAYVTGTAADHYRHT